MCVCVCMNVTLHISLDVLVSNQIINSVIIFSYAFVSWDDYSDFSEIMTLI